MQSFEEYRKDFLEDVGGGHEGETHLPVQGTAQEGGNAGMGVNHIGVLLPNDLPQDSAGLPHGADGAQLQRGLVVADAGGGDLRNIDTAVGDDGDVMSLLLEFLSQLHDMRLSATDVQTHGCHENFHVMFLQLSFSADLSRWNRSDP